MRKLSTGLALLAAGAGLPAWASGSGGEALLTPAIGTIFWTVVTFVALMFLLRRFAWGPLLGAIEDREKQIQGSIDQTRADREEAQSLLQEQRELVTAAQRERAAALEQGRRDAETLKQEILDEARKQKQQLVEQTEMQVQASLRQAQDELRGSAADLAILAAERLLTRTLDEPGHRRLVEDYLSELERSGGGSGSLPS